MAINFQSGKNPGTVSILDTAAFSRTDPARPWASSCQLRSGVSLVPKSEGPGHPRCGFWGVETEATRQHPHTACGV
jgi:hypothetical protein